MQKRKEYSEKAHRTLKQHKCNHEVKFLHSNTIKSWEISSYMLNNNKISKLHIKVIISAENVHITLSNKM